MPTPKPQLALLGSALALMVLPAQAQVLNGSFENQTSTASNQPGGSTAITDWTTTLNGVEYFKPSDIPGGTAAEGDWIVDLAYLDFAGGGIQQQITTTMGQTSRLNFSLGTRADLGRSGTAAIVLLIDGADAATYNVSNFTSGFVYSDFSYDFTPTSETTTIEFQSRQNGLAHFAYVDDVSFEEIVPEPGVGLLLGAGLMFWGGARPRRSNR